MSTPSNQPEPPHATPPNADRGRSSQGSEARLPTEDLLPGEERRGIAEWAVVLALIALIVGVAWSQFGPLFQTSTAGSDGSAPTPGAGLELVVPEPNPQPATEPDANQE